MPQILLESNDRKVFVADIEIRRKSSVIKYKMEDGLFDDDYGEPVFLPHVYASSLVKIIQWVEFHKNDPPVENNAVNISEFDKDLFNMSQEALYELIRAATFLDMSELLDVLNIIRHRHQTMFRGLGRAENQEKARGKDFQDVKQNNEDMAKKLQEERGKKNVILAVPCEGTCMCSIL